MAEEEARSIDFGVMLLDGRLPEIVSLPWYTELDDNSLLTLTSCPEEFHFESGVCTSDIRSCLPMPANTTEGAQTWDRVVRDYGVCTATACTSGYHIEFDACVSDTRSCSPLPPNATAATQTWDSVASEYGVCIATGCAVTYHIESGACVSDNDNGASCCVANNGCPMETGSSCAGSSCCCCPVGQACDQVDPSIGCVASP